MKDLSGFYSALGLLENQISEILKRLPQYIAEKTEEIRLRAGRPLALGLNGKTVFVTNKAQTTDNFAEGFYINAEMLALTVKNICGSSVYSHTDEIQNGFITMPYGNRAGIAGSFKQGKFCDISSVNIRISHECTGVSQNFVKGYSGGSVLICGPPSSGKTTFLRDVVRGISNGECGKYYKISLIDTRNEIAAMYCGVPQNNVGVNTDVISGREKSYAIDAAVRSMSPEIIAFDEIGTTDEVNAVLNGINCGAYIITTAHIESPYKLLMRNVTRLLIEKCGIEKIIYLSVENHIPYEFYFKEGKICGL